MSDVTVEADLLTYYIDEWASDYDIMVAIMNALEEENIESEPYFDDNDEMVVNKETETAQELCDDDSDDSDDSDEHDEHDGEHAETIDEHIGYR